MLPIKYIISGIALLGLIATAYFAVQSYNSVIADNQKLKQQVSGLTAERDTYKRISETVSENEQATQTIIQNTRTIEREIQKMPVTTQCVDAPAIKYVIDRLRDDAGPTEAN